MVSRHKQHIQQTHPQKSFNFTKKQIKRITKTPIKKINKNNQTNKTKNINTKKPQFQIILTQTQTKNKKIRPIKTPQKNKQKKKTNHNTKKPQEKNKSKKNKSYSRRIAVCFFEAEQRPWRFVGPALLSSPNRCAAKGHGVHNRPALVLTSLRLTAASRPSTWILAE